MKFLKNQIFYENTKKLSRQKNHKITKKEFYKKIKTLISIH